MTFVISLARALLCSNVRAFVISRLQCMDTGADEMEAEIALANDLAQHAQKVIAEERHAAAAADLSLGAQRGKNLFGAASRS